MIQNNIKIRIFLNGCFRFQIIQKYISCGYTNLKYIYNFLKIIIYNIKYSQKYFMNDIYVCFQIPLLCETLMTYHALKSTRYAALMS